MAADSPHLYRRRGRELGRSEELLDTVAAYSTMLQGRGVAVVLTLRHLAHLTGAPYGHLRDIVARTSDPYREFNIRRHTGRSPRLISAPESIVMGVQRWILDRILNRVHPHPASFAYQPGRSIRACAEQHLGARWMIKLDLHNFFHSIDERQVYGVFADLGYPNLLAFELARLCTRKARGSFPHPTRFTVPWQRRYETVTGRRVARTDFGNPYTAIPAYRTNAMGFVPQGAPTSGALANLIANSLDERLSDLAQDGHLVYTRYADDIVLSGTTQFDRDAAVAILRDACDEIRAAGFAVHAKKTRLVPPGARHIVLGLLVDGDKPRLSRDTRSRIQAHIRGADKFGLNSHQTERRFASALGMVHHIDGLLAFARDIEPEWASEMHRRWRLILARDAPLLGGADIFGPRYDTLELPPHRADDPFA